MQTGLLPLASVVIPNFNGMEHLDECLNSLLALDYDGPRPEVIVADNGSSDGSVQHLKKHYPWVQVINMGSNLGFAAACNRGAEAAKGTHVAFLNNDMRVDRGWLQELVLPLESGQDVAATSSRILTWDGKAVDFVGGAVNFYGHGFQPLHGQPASDAQALEVRPVLFACGGSMAAKRQLFLSAGGFDEDYFAFFEDIDLGWRFWVLGYRVLFIPQALAYHKGHATGSKLPAHQLRVLYERNALATIIKNYDDASLARVLPAALLLAGKRALVYGGIDVAGYRPWANDKVDSEQVKRVGLSHLVALSDLADDSERLLEKRAVVQSARQRADREILALLESPFETNCLDIGYMQSQREVQSAFGVEGMFSGVHGSPRILIISNDTVQARMAGPGIRAWEMAQILAQTLSVTLAVPNEDPPQAATLRVVTYGSKAGRGLRQLAAEHDVLVVQGFVLHLFPFLGQMGKVLVVDLYDPFTLENLHVFSHDPMDERSAVHQSHLEVLNAQLRAGDYFLCASEKQRDYWLGMLAANNRINPHLYDADPTLRQLIDVVPFGVPSQPPVATARVLKGVYPGIEPGDRVILWGGGIWEWFDPLTLIHAVDRIRRDRPEVKLFFLGVKHPNPLVPEMQMTRRAVETARDLGLLGTGVFFNDWVPYDQRQNYLVESDVGVSLHFDHLETRYSFRTRVLDYIWAGLPIVCSRGDAVGEMVEANQLGRVVDYCDVDGLVSALIEVLDQPAGKLSYAERLSKVAEGLTWEHAMAPLVAFSSAPRVSPDRLAARSLAAEPLFGPRTRDGWHGALLPDGRRLPTPLWGLPMRAITYLRMGGAPRLWQEAQSYVRWLRLRSAR